MFLHKGLNSIINGVFKMLSFHIPKLVWPPNIQMCMCIINIFLMFQLNCMNINIYQKIFIIVSLNGSPCIIWTPLWGWKSFDTNINQCFACLQVILHCLNLTWEISQYKNDTWFGNLLLKLIRYTQWFVLPLIKASSITLTITIGNWFKYSLCFQSLLTAYRW